MDNLDVRRARATHSQSLFREVERSTSADTERCLVESAAGPRPRLLFFYSPTAGTSRRVEAFLAQVLQRRRNHDTFIVHRIDVTKRPDLAERFGVEATPTVFVVDGKRVAARVDTPKGVQDLERVMRPWLH